jgi:hypothetical protein
MAFSLEEGAVPKCRSVGSWPNCTEYICREAGSLFLFITESGSLVGMRITILDFSDSPFFTCRKGHAFMGKYVFQHPQGKSHTYDALLKATHAVEALSSGHRSHAGGDDENIGSLFELCMSGIIPRRAGPGKFNSKYFFFFNSLYESFDRKYRL